MSAFDIRLTILGIQAAVPTDEELERGADPEIDLILTVGSVIGSSAGMMPFPLGKVRFALDRDGAETLAQSVGETAEKLPAKVKVDVASPGDMREAEAVASRLEELRRQADG